METDLDYLGMPEPSADILDRVRYLIKLSRRTQAQFSRLVGIDPSNLSRILSGRMPITDVFVNRLVVNLNVSKQWLTEGTDVPFPRGEHARELGDGREQLLKSGDSTVPGAAVYDIDVTAGSLELSRMFTDERIVGYVNLPDVDPRYPLVRVSGDSMSPKINPGSYISIRPISDTSPIFWGQVYVVVLEDYRMVKYLRRHPDKDFVILHSANPAYDDIEIPRRDILRLYLVETILNYDIIA